MLPSGAIPKLSTAETAVHSMPEQAGLRVETIGFESDSPTVTTVS